MFREQLDAVARNYPKLHTVELLRDFLTEFFGGPIKQEQPEKVANYAQ